MKYKFIYLIATLTLLVISLFILDSVFYQISQEYAVGAVGQINSDYSYNAIKTQSDVMNTQQYIMYALVVMFGYLNFKRFFR